MPLLFPASPNVNDTHTEGSITYKWDGDKWIGLGLTPVDRLVEGSNKLEIESNNLLWTGDDVGIGTDTPDQHVELFKASGTNLLKVSTEANSTIGIELEKTGATTQSWRIADGQTVNGTLEFYDVTDSLTRLSIDGSGRVIVGGGSHAGGGALVVKGTSDTPNAYGCAAFAKIGANPISGTTLAQLRFSAGSGGTNRAAEIDVQADSNWNDGTNQESKMIFKVAENGGGNTAGNALMTLKGSGDVEINRGNIQTDSGSIIANNGTLQVDKHIIDGTDDWSAASYELHYRKTFTNNTWTDYFKFDRSDDDADNNDVGVFAGYLHIVYINDRSNSVHATGYDVFPFIVRGRSNNTLSGTFGSAIVDLHEVIGSAVDVRFDGATTTLINMQIKINNVDDGGSEQICHAWITGGGAANISNRFLYPERI